METPAHCTADGNAPHGGGATITITPGGGGGSHECTHPTITTYEGQFGDTIDHCESCGLSQARGLWERGPDGRMRRVPDLGAVTEGDWVIMPGGDLALTIGRSPGRYAHQYFTTSCCLQPRCLEGDGGQCGPMPGRKLPRDQWPVLRYCPVCDEDTYHRP